MNLPNIDPEFRRLIPPLSPEEYKQLEDNLVHQGCRDALVVWGGKDILLDGHNRLEICLKHNIPFRRTDMTFKSRAEAANWIDTNQLGRRNLSPAGASLLRGRVYERTKKAHGGTGANQHTEQSTQNGDSAKTTEILAEKFGVSKNTIQRDAQFARAVETLKDVAPDLEQQIVSGEAPARAVVVEAANVARKANEKLIQNLQMEAAAAMAEAKELVQKNNILHSSKSNEWYTPAEYVDAARELMNGGIDLDPASCEFANRVVRAAHIFTVEDNGLAHEWDGRVWLNPPYGKNKDGSQQEVWSRYLIEQYRKGNCEQAVLLVTAAPGNKWFAPLWDFPICFPDHRIRFYDSSGKPSQPTHSNAIVYIGTNIEKFHAIFSKFGVVAVRYDGIR